MADEGSIGTAGRWLEDMPQQFQGKRNIEILVRAFSRQLDEILRVFEDLVLKTDVDTAIGQNLDRVGTIIPLTRKEAGELAGNGFTEPVISDEKYRLFLRYQILRNTSECTYYDLIDGVELLWGYDRIHYIEDPEYPATIFFQTDRLDLDEEDFIEMNPKLCIRPAGVGVTLRKHFGGFYDVPVRYKESIKFIACFYPRYNLPQLKLDSKWKLGGGRKLSGYNSQEAVDFYPVSARFQMGPASAIPDEMSRIYLPFSAGGESGIRAGSAIVAKTSASGGVSSGEQVGISASAAHAMGAGHITIYNKNRLDGGWKLNGRRKLNGGVETR